MVLDRPGIEQLQDASPGQGLEPGRAERSDRSTWLETARRSALESRRGLLDVCSCPRRVGHRRRGAGRGGAVEDGHLAAPATRAPRLRPLARPTNTAHRAGGKSLASRLPTRQQAPRREELVVTTGSWRPPALVVAPGLGGLLHVGPNCPPTVCAKPIQDGQRAVDQEVTSVVARGSQGDAPDAQRGQHGCRCITVGSGRWGGGAVVRPCSGCFPHWLNRRWNSSAARCPGQRSQVIRRRCGRRSRAL